MGAPAVSVPTSPARKPAPKRRQSAPARRVSTPSKRAAANHTAIPAPRKAPPRRRSAPSRRRARHTPAGGVVMLPVHAVAGTAGAVGGIADSPLVVTLTRGRAWIALLGVLLGGIVALNVWGLSLSASSSATAVKIDELEQANSVAAARIARRSSSDKIAALAASQGLDTAAPKAIEYLKSKNSDAAAAAKRLQAGEISVLDGLAIAPEFSQAAIDAAGQDGGDALLTAPVAEDPITDPAVAAGTDPAAATTDPATGTTDATTGTTDATATPTPQATDPGTELGGVTP